MKGQLFILHDLGNKEPITSRDIPTIIATLPKDSKYNEFMKVYRNEKVFIPGLTDAEMFKLDTIMKFEMQTVNGEKCSTWQKSAYYFGNIPRHVFGTVVGATASFNDLKKQLSRLELNNKLRSEEAEPTMDVNDKLVMYTPVNSDEKEYESSTISFKKGYIADEVAKKLFLVDVEEWSKLMCDTPSGNIFEAAVHEFIGAHPHALPPTAMTHMPASTTSKKSDSSKKTALTKLWPTSTNTWDVVILNANQRLSLVSGSYYYPRKPNFPVVDSFVYKKLKKVHHLVCFQMTLKATHKPTLSTIQKFMGEFKKTFTLNGNPAEIVVDTSGSLQLKFGTTTEALTLSIIYITRNEALKKYQNIHESTGTDAEKESAKNTWACVDQYWCDVPKL
jgi:hypothetical protein